MKLDHELGYYEESVNAFLTEISKLEGCSKHSPANFWKWMDGQTTAFVNNHTVVYPYDLERFIKGKPIQD